MEADLDNIGFLWRRRQFPVYPAFAFTLNKAQGQTILGRVGIFSWHQCILHGQLYVATSRITHSDHAKYFLLKVERTGLEM